MHCKHGLGQIHFHDIQVSLLPSEQSKTMHHPIVEPRVAGKNHTRPDIEYLGSTRGREFFDITYMDPLALSRRQVPPFNPLNSLNAAQIEKVEKNRAGMLEIGSRNRLILVPLSALGAWCPGAYNILMKNRRSRGYANRWLLLDSS